jgi:hypothetical protein
MITNGNSIKCDDHYENVHIQMGHFSFKPHIVSIEMGGCDIVLGVEGLWTLGLITMDFLDLYTSFHHEGNHYTFK